MAPSPGLTCSDVVELVTDYVEGTLPADVAGRVAAHLAECDGCATYLEQMMQTAAALRRVELAGLSDAACAELRAAFRDWSAAGHA
ncbi:MAG TPA: zf-HC2 domain-containing protein [Jatrophihabitans sp.]|nr:zf-HC2 domain-containing protein [Jatrophihabitans sp.]